MNFKIRLEFSIEINEKPITKHITDKSWGRLRRIVRKRDNSHCRYCGEFSADGHADHVIPLAKGGTDSIDNLVWACPDCNLAKGTNTIAPMEPFNSVRPKVHIATPDIFNEDVEGYALPIDKSRLTQIAHEILINKRLFSAGALARILNQEECMRLESAMVASGLLVKDAEEKSELTQMGRVLMDKLLRKGPGYDLPISERKLRSLAKLILIDKERFSKRAISGPGKPLSDNDYNPLKESMLDAGFLELVGKSLTTGYRLTGAGEKLLEMFLPDGEQLGML